MLPIALFMAVAPARSEVTDNDTPSVPKGRLLNSDELWAFVSSETAYELVDMATREPGTIALGVGRISISWYFAGKDDIAVLTRNGISCVVIRRDQQPTKCIAISEVRFSGNCRFIVQEVRDKRAACLREAPAP